MFTTVVQRSSLALSILALTASSQGALAKDSSAQHIFLSDLGHMDGLVVSALQPDHTITIPRAFRDTQGTATFNLKLENQFIGYNYAALSIYVDNQLDRVVRLDGGAIPGPITVTIPKEHEDRDVSVRLKLMSKFNDDACFDERIGPGFIRVLPTTGFSSDRLAHSLQLAWIKLGQRPEIVLPLNASDTDVATAALFYDALIREGRKPEVVQSDTPKSGQIFVSSPIAQADDFAVDEHGVIHVRSGSEELHRALEQGLPQSSLSGALSAKGLATSDWASVSSRPGQVAFAYETGQIVHHFNLADFEQHQIPTAYKARIVLPPEETDAPTQLYVSLNGRLLHSEPVRATGEPHNLNVALIPDMLELHNKLQISVVRDDVAGKCQTRPQPAPFELLAGADFETRTVTKTPDNFVSVATQMEDNLSVFLAKGSQLDTPTVTSLIGQMSYHFRSRGGTLAVNAFDPAQPAAANGIYFSDVKGAMGAIAQLGDEKLEISPRGDAGAVRLISDNDLLGLQVTGIGGGSLPAPSRLDLSRGSLAIFDSAGTRFEFNDVVHKPELIGPVQASSLLGSVTLVKGWAWLVGLCGLIGLGALATVVRRKG